MLARERYEEGYDSYLDVVEAQRSLYAAQDSLAQSDQQLIDDLIAIYKALGGGWGSDGKSFTRGFRTGSNAGVGGPRYGSVLRVAPARADASINIPPVSAARSSRLP